MLRDTRENFENILFDPSREIDEKSTNGIGEYITALYCKGELLAERIITASGTDFYKTA